MVDLNNHDHERRYHSLALSAKYHIGTGVELYKGRDFQIRRLGWMPGTENGEIVLIMECSSKKTPVRNLLTRHVHCLKPVG